jgi:hypothetical protein
VTDAKARLASDWILAALAPTNYLATNPAALKRAFETGGASVLAGTRNFLDDLRNNNGMPRQVDTRPYSAHDASGWCSNDLTLDISRGCLTFVTQVGTLVCTRHRGGTMTNTKTVGQELQGEILKSVRKSQDAVVDAIQMWADAVQSIKPPLPEVSIPFTDNLPKPSELVAGAYDFAEQLLAAQRKFAEDVLHATAPLFYGNTTPTAKKTGTTAK